MKKSLDIWLVTIGEPLPIDGEFVRLHRVGLLAQYLINKGHRVTWWNSTFDHQNRRSRFSETTHVNISGNYKIILLHGGGYTRNVSLERIKDHIAVANDFKEHSRNLPRPNVIVASFPTIELCEEALDYGEENKVPVIIDYRDLWPEAFINLLPRFLHPLGNIALYSVNTRVKKIFKRANGIIGISKPFVEIALSKAGRQWGPFDEVIYLGYPNAAGDEAKEREGKRFWESIGIGKDNDVFRICFFGNIARRNLDLFPVIESARILQQRERKIEFIFCGKGDGLEAYKKATWDLENTFFPGFLDANQIRSLMKISDIGILPYVPSIDFNNSIPNKAIEYLSEGLPVLTSLYGHLGELIKEFDCGFVYKFNDPGTLVDIIEGLADNKHDLTAKKENAKKLFLNTFSADVVYNKMCNLIEKISTNSIENDNG